jgi:hypothetical protein
METELVHEEFFEEAPKTYCFKRPIYLDPSLPNFDPRADFVAENYGVLYKKYNASELYYYSKSTGEVNLLDPLFKGVNKGELMAWDGSTWRSTKLRSNMSITGDGVLTPLELSRQNAEHGQVLTWIGNSWKPAIVDRGAFIQEKFSIVKENVSFSFDLSKLSKDVKWVIPRDEITWTSIINNSVFLGSTPVEQEIGESNTVLGIDSATLITSGEYNTVVGSNVAPHITEGKHNLLLGANCCSSLTTGSNNIVLAGDVLNFEVSNVVSLGAIAYNSNSFYVRTSSVRKRKTDLLMYYNPANGEVSYEEFDISKVPLVVNRNIAIEDAIKGCIKIFNGSQWVNAKLTEEDIPCISADRITSGMIHLDRIPASGATHQLQLNIGGMLRSSPLLVYKNNYLGIGTNVPDKLLSVVGKDATVLIKKDADCFMELEPFYDYSAIKSKDMSLVIHHTTKRVGIECSTPLSTLHVGGDISIDGLLKSHNKNLCIVSNTTMKDSTSYIQLSQNIEVGGTIVNLCVGPSGKRVPKLVINDLGYVGIGHSLPRSLLDVNLGEFVFEPVMSACATFAGLKSITKVAIVNRDVAELAFCNTIGKTSAAITYNGKNNMLQLGVGTEYYLNVNYLGYLGIGCTPQLYPLEVKGAANFNNKLVICPTLQANPVLQFKSEEPDKCTVLFNSLDRSGRATNLVFQIADASSKTVVNLNDKENWFAHNIGVRVSNPSYAFEARNDMLHGCGLALHCLQNYVKLHTTPNEKASLCYSNKSFELINGATPVFTVDENFTINRKTELRKGVRIHNTLELIKNEEVACSIIWDGRNMSFVGDSLFVEMNYSGVSLNVSGKKQLVCDTQGTTINSLVSIKATNTLEQLRIGQGVESSFLSVYDGDNRAGLLQGYLGRFSLKTDNASILELGASSIIQFMINRRTVAFLDEHALEVDKKIKTKVVVLESECPEIVLKSSVNKGEAVISYSSTNKVQSDLCIVNGVQAVKIDTCGNTWVKHISTDVVELILERCSLEYYTAFTPMKLNSFTILLEASNMVLGVIDEKYRRKHITCVPVCGIIRDTNITYTTLYIEIHEDGRVILCSNLKDIGYKVEVSSGFI